jgi:hypothetical protein
MMPSNVHRPSGPGALIVKSKLSFSSVPRRGHKLRTRGCIRFEPCFQFGFPDQNALNAARLRNFWIALL